MVEDLIKDHKILIMVGSGGVGKTTSSIAIAMRAAMLGRKVGLLSIDPAKRLAAALGIELGNEMREIRFPEGMTPKGSVKAAMIDQKVVFDSMVKKHAVNAKAAKKIMDNPIYRAASTNLGGPLEYMALAKLRDLAVDPQFDLIVLDTPPDTHALDFLAKPNVLAGFFDNKVMTWMLRPFSIASKFGFGKVMSAGEKMMGGIAKIAGVSALSSFADFLLLTQDVIEGFHRAGEQIVALLESEETSFVLVTIPTPAAQRSAVFLQGLLEKMNYSCDAVVFNRCCPISNDESQDSGQNLDLSMQTAAGLNSRRIHGERRVIDKLKESLIGNRAKPPMVISVSEQQQELHTADAIVDFSMRF